VNGHTYQRIALPSPLSSVLPICGCSAVFNDLTDGQIIDETLKIENLFAIMQKE